MERIQRLALALAERGVSSFLVRVLLFPVVVVLVALVGTALLAVVLLVVSDVGLVSPVVSDPPLGLLSVYLLVASVPVVAYYRFRYRREDGGVSVRGLLRRHPIRIPVLTVVVFAAALAFLAALFVGFLLMSAPPGPQYYVSCFPVTATPETPADDAASLSSFPASQRQYLRRAIENGSVSVPSEEATELPRRVAVRYRNQTYECVRRHTDV